jgi:Tfp pilus assembly protein PilF
VKAAAERALQLDPDLPEAHLSLAFALSDYYWDFEAAARHYRRAIELNPSYAAAHNGYSQFLRFQGRFDEALAQSRQAEQLDPLTPNHQLVTATTLYLARRYDESMAQLRRVLDANPLFAYAHFFRALVHVQMGEYEKALAALDEPGAGGNLQRDSLRGYIHAITGRQKEAREGLDKLKRFSQDQDISPFHSAVIHVGLGEHDRALDLLEQAYRDHDWEVRMLPFEPLFDPLHSHPRFRALVEKFK